MLPLKLLRDNLHESYAMAGFGVLWEMYSMCVYLSYFRVSSMAMQIS